MSATAVTSPPQERSRAPRGRAGSARALDVDQPAGEGIRTAALQWGLCALPIICLLVAWAVDDGGYDSVTWLASGLGLTVLAVWSRLVFGAPRPLGRYGRIALGALALYVIWSYASIAWATDKGTALLGSDRALLYLLLFWLVAGLEWTRRRLELGMTLYVFGVGVVAVGILAELSLGPAPQLLQGGQLAAGLGYHNATAALGTIGAAGAILIGSSSARRPLVRAGLAAVAVACLEVSLLAESRGWLYTLPLIALALFALAPRRGRTVLWGLLPTAGVLATLPWVLHSWRLADGAASGSVAAADLSTARVGLLAAVLSGVVAWVIAHGDERHELSQRGKRLARRASRVFAALTVLGAAAVAAFLIQSGKLAHGWHQFTTNAPLRAGVSRFDELGSGRYDMWRVALKSFAAHPLGGLGQDNFAQAYVAGRHTGEEPLWVHSLELRLLAHTGAVGFVLFAAFLVCALLAFRSAALRGNRGLRLALVAALVPLTVWVIHGSVDWFWEIPALSGPAFVFLAAALALEPRRAAGGRLLQRGSQRFAALLSGGRWTVSVSAVIAVLVLLGAGYLGERELGQARALASTKPAAALSDLAQSAQLEPFNSAPLALGAGLELSAGHGASALDWARDGLRRDPGDWVLWLEDGLAAGSIGQRSAERAALARARTLDPREPVIALAQRRADTAHPLTIAQAASMLVGRARQRVAP